MSKKTGAGINLIFFVITLLLAGALIAIGVYTYFHKSERAPKPEIKSTLSEAIEKTTTSFISSTTSNTTTTTTSISVTTTSTTKISKLKYHEYNETVAAKPSEAVIILNQEESGDLFHYYPNSSLSFTNFSEKAAIGLDKEKDGSSASFCINSPNAKYSKGDIGFNAEIKDNKNLKVESYGGSLSDLRIVSNNNKYSDINYTVDVKNGKLEADLTDGSFSNGLYVINGQYLVDSKTYNLNIYIYVNCKSDNINDMNFYLCESTQYEASNEAETTSSENTSVTTTKIDD